MGSGSRIGDRKHAPHRPVAGAGSKRDREGARRSQQKRRETELLREMAVVERKLGKPVSPLAVDDSPDPACRARRAAGRMAWTGISRTSTRTKASKSTVKSLPDRAKAPRPGLALEPRQPGADQRPVIEEVEVPPARAFSVIDRTGLAALQADCVRSRAAWKSSSSSSAAISCWDGRLRRQQVRTPPRPYPRIRQGARPIDAPPAP